MDFGKIENLNDKFQKIDFNKLNNQFYWQDAADILYPFFKDFINKEELNLLTKKAYSSFEIEDMTPLIQLDDNKYLLELFHGPTLAFKDFAMLLLAELFDLSLKKRNVYYGRYEKTNFCKKYY